MSGTLRRKSKKRAATDRAAAKFREQIIAEVGRCEWCGRYFSLCCHEISRGSSRLKSLEMRSCILVLCNAPHGMRPSCHGQIQAWDRAKQLALLYLRRPGDYNLQAYWEVIGRRKPEQCDVMDSLTF